MTKISFTVNMLVMVVTWSVIAWLIWILLQVNAYGETYPVRVVGSSSLSHASATCVGKSKDTSLFLTNRHVVRNSKEIYVADGNKWLRVQRVKVDKKADIASFTIESTNFKKTSLCVDYPAGKPVTVCGYSRRDRFCFKGLNTGKRVEANGRHVLPGDSGGAVLVRAADNRVYCVGVANAFGPQDKVTHYIPAKECSLHLTQYYSYPPVVTQWCPGGRCRVYPVTPMQTRPNYSKSYKYSPRLFGPPKVEIYEQLTNPAIVQTPLIPPQQINTAPLPSESRPSAVSNTQIQKAVDNWMAKNQDKIAGPPGKDGASVNISELAAYLAANYAADLKGAPGSPGLAGKDGGGVAATHDRVIIMRENGREIDRETYAIDEPFVFNVETFVRQ